LGHDSIRLLQEPEDFSINKFRMLVKQNLDKSLMKEVKFSMDCGATYKLGNKGRMTKRQKQDGYIQAKVRRGNVNWM